jgi:enamine deaminase RidA (YjgF/YER057c/UK114 family)
VTDARRRIGSGGPYEARFGYSRAIVDGDTCWVSGTTDAGAGGASLHPGDVAAQARASWEIVGRALTDAGFDLADVVRTRMYVVEVDDSTTVGEVHGEVFGEIRPASTMVQVAGLVHPSLLVEVEAEARRRTGG